MKNIPIGQFKALPQNEQYDIVHNFGVHLTHYHKLDYLLALYQFHSFYVEVIFKFSKLIAIHCYLSPNELNRYLKRIDISELGLSVSQ